jgi:hypothetical protein
MKINLIAFLIATSCISLAIACSPTTPKAAAGQPICTVQIDAQNTDGFKSGTLSAIATRSASKELYCYKLYNGPEYLGEAKVRYLANPAPHTDGTIVSVSLTPAAIGKNSVRVLLGNDNYVFSYGDRALAGNEGKNVKFAFYLRDEKIVPIPKSK